MKFDVVVYRGVEAVVTVEAGSPQDAVQVASLLSTPLPLPDVWQVDTDSYRFTVFDEDGEIAAQSPED